MQRDIAEMIQIGDAFDFDNVTTVNSVGIGRHRVWDAHLTPGRVYRDGKDDSAPRRKEADQEQKVREHHGGGVVGRPQVTGDSGVRDMKRRRAFGKVAR